MESCYFFVKVGVQGQPNKFEDYWLQIAGLWLTISKKVGQQACFLLPLDLVRLTSGEEETHIPNSILLETSKITGSHVLYIVSTSRIEVILLFEALFQGCELMKNHQLRSCDEVRCDFQTSHGLLSRSKQPGQLVITKQEVRIGDKETIPLQDLVSMSFKLNDPNCDNRLVLVANTAEGKKQREIHVLNKMAAMQLFMPLIKQGTKA